MKDYLKEAKDKLAVKLIFCDGEAVVRLKDALLIAELYDAKVKSFIEDEVRRKTAEKLGDNY